MEEIIYDVIVVGAGPGGSWAAKIAAGMGLKVLLVEQQRRIGYSFNCAEGVGKNHIEEILGSLDEKHISKKLKGLEVFFPDGTNVSADGEAYILDRPLFERHLATRATDAGADILMRAKAKGFARENEKAKLEILHSGKKFSLFANVVIAADGPNSNIGRLAGINVEIDDADWIHCEQYLLYSLRLKDLDRAEIYIGNKYTPDGGYIWIFPKGDGLANVGIGMFEPNENVVAGYLDKFVNANFSKYEIMGISAGKIPGAPIKAHSADNILLVGDAARKVNPLTGGGIRYAMLSGDFAARTAYKAIKNGDTSAEGLKEYEKILWEKMGKEFDKLYKFTKFARTLEDAKLNKLGRSLQGIDFSEISAFSFVKRLLYRNPWLPFRYATDKIKNKL